MRKSEPSKRPDMRVATETADLINRLIVFSCAILSNSISLIPLIAAGT